MENINLRLQYSVLLKLLGELIEQEVLLLQRKCRASGKQLLLQYAITVVTASNY